MKDTQSRKWLITINNPVEYGFTHDQIKENLAEFKSLVYWCISDEIGEEGTFHTHIYVAFSSAVRFSSLKKQFDEAHFDMAKGTSQQNRDYVFKEGKWANDKKSDTNLRETHEEYGEIPIERQGQRNDIADLYDMIKKGMSDYEIMEESPEYMLTLDKIERARQIINEERFKNMWRDLHVTYICGKTGCGKTRGVMEEYGYSNCYRVTDYDHPWDSYKGQDVIIFEEFRSSLKIGDMLNYLDGYPLELPCRYNNKRACFTKVFIISNWDFDMQYADIQRNHKETWNAFVRRVHEIKMYQESGKVFNKIDNVIYIQECIQPDLQDNDFFEGIEGD